MGFAPGQTSGINQSRKLVKSEPSLKLLYAKRHYFCAMLVVKAVKPANYVSNDYNQLEAVYHINLSLTFHYNLAKGLNETKTKSTNYEIILAMDDLGPSCLNQ